MAFTLRSGRGIKADWLKVALVATIIPLLYLANTFFYAMRVSSWHLGESTAALSTLVPRAVELLEGGPDPHFEHLVDENLRDRTFVIRYFSDLLTASWTHQPLYGKDMAFCFKSAIPSLLYLDKDTVKAIGIEENLVNPEFGLPAYDEANSILTTGVSDFGIAGVFIYPILLVIGIRKFLDGVSPKLPEAVRIVLLFSIVYVLFQTEVSTPSYFVVCRNLLLVSFSLVFLGVLATSIVAPTRHLKGVRIRRISARRAVTLYPSEPSL
jgi:hypothetical protein